MPSTDEYIRNIRFSDHVKACDGSLKVLRKVFFCDENDANFGLSVTACGEEIISESDVDDYQNVVCRHPAGILGVCFLKLEQIEASRLIVIPDPTGVERFQRLHCLVRDERQGDLCPTRDAASMLALAATQNGRIRPMQPTTDNNLSEE